MRKVFFLAIFKVSHLHEHCTFCQIKNLEQYSFSLKDNRWKVYICWNTVILILSHYKMCVILSIIFFFFNLKLKKKILIFNELFLHSLTPN